MENGYIESFNGRLRDECLNVNLFFSLEDARKKLESGREMTTWTDSTGAITARAFAAAGRDRFFRPGASSGSEDLSIVFVA